MLTIANTMSTDEIKSLLKVKTKKAKAKRSPNNQAVINHLRDVLRQRGVR